MLPFSVQIFPGDGQRHNTRAEYARSADKRAIESAKLGPEQQIRALHSFSSALSVFGSQFDRPLT